MSFRLMMFYRAIRHLLFKLSPEKAHALTLAMLKYIPSICLPKIVDKPVSVMGLDFPNPIGLAAGLDKNGDYLEGLSKLGFGFIELGTVTPKPQSGNPQPRLFRIPQAMALINRMGFNNHGVDYLINKLQASCYKGVLGINIGKNLSTPLEQAVEDYLYCFNKVYPYASYIAINLSSPNTPGLRQLQQGDEFANILARLKQRQAELNQHHLRYVPLAIKIAPDMDKEAAQQLASDCLRFKIDAIIATNTTSNHEAVSNYQQSKEQGGLSGAPLTQPANQMLTWLVECLDGKIPVIAVGGIMTENDALTRFDNGANLIQLYTGLIYQGPNLIASIAKKLRG